MNTEVTKDLIELVNGMKAFVKSKSVKYGATTFEYVPLDDILDRVSQFPKWAVMQPLSNNENGVPCVETILIHETGEKLSSGKLTLFTTGTKMQDFGSVITYTRRYQLGAFLGINTEVDNDATDQKPVETKATKSQLDKLEMAYTEATKQKVYEHYKIAKLADLTLKQASELVARLEQKK